MHIHFISTDARQNAAKEALDRDFFATSGAFSATNDPPDIVVLPIPTTRDGISLTESDLTLEALHHTLPQKTALIGYGDKPAAFGSRPYIDLSQDEIFVSANAALTAEGAASMLFDNLHREYGLSLESTVPVILGYGRIAQSLAKRLSPFACPILIGARRTEARMAAAGNGYFSFDLSNREFFSGRGRLLFKERPHILINTVPSAAVIGCAEEMPSPLFGLELSGRNDVLAACRALPFPVLDGRALPARRTPVAAGRLLAAAIRRSINNRTNLST